jgi:hypothetical protein
LCFQKAKVDDTSGDLFKKQIEEPLTIVQDFHYALFAVGPVAFIICVVLLVIRYRRSRKVKPENLATPILDDDQTTLLNGTGSLLNGTTTTQHGTIQHVNGTTDHVNYGALPIQ